MGEKFIERMIYMPKSKIDYSKIATGLENLCLVALEGAVPAVSLTRGHLRDSAHASRESKKILEDKIESFRDASSELLDIVRKCAKHIKEKDRGDDNKYYYVCTAIKCLYTISNSSFPAVTSVEQPVGLRDSHVTRIVDGVGKLNQELSRFERRNGHLSDEAFNMISLPRTDDPIVRGDPKLLKYIQKATALFRTLGQ